MRRGAATAWSSAPPPVPSFVSAGALTATVGSIAKPASVTTGDSVFLLLGSDTGTHTTPSGFTLVGTVTNTGSDRLSIFQRIIDGSEGSTFSATGSGANVGLAIAYRHVATGARDVTTGSTSSVTSTAYPAVASIAGDAVLGFAMHTAIGGAAGFSTPPGNTERVDADVNPVPVYSIQIVDLIPAAGATGSASVAVGSAGRFTLIRAAFAPA